MTDAHDIEIRIRRAAERWPSVNPQEFENLARMIGQLPPEERLAPLLGVFVNPPPDAYPSQEYAGQLLMQLKPQCPHPVDATLRQVLPRWNRSVEQLPLYLREVFGLDAVLGSLDRLADEGVDPHRLDTLRHWLNVHRKPG